MKTRIDQQKHLWRGITLWHLLVAAGILSLLSATFWFAVKRNDSGFIEARLFPSDQAEGSQLLLPLRDSEADLIVEKYLDAVPDVAHLDLVSPLYAIPEISNTMNSISFSFYRDAPLLSSLDLYCLIDNVFTFIPSDLLNETGEVTSEGAGGVCGLFSVEPESVEIVEVRQDVSSSDAGGGSIAIDVLSASGGHDPLIYVPYKSYLDSSYEAGKPEISGVLIDLRHSTLTDAEWRNFAEEPIRAALYLPSSIDGDSEILEVLASRDLAAHVDYYLIDMVLSPTEFYSGGRADTLISSLTRLIDRQKIIPVISASPLLIDAATPLDADTPTLSRLGNLEFASDVKPAGRIFTTSEEIWVHAGFTEIPLYEDAQTAILSYEIIGDNGVDKFFLNDFYNLRQRLDFLAQFGFHTLGISIGPDGTADLQLLISALSPDAPYPERVWPQIELIISDEENSVVSHVFSMPGEAVSWIPTEEGEYSLTLALVYPGARMEFADSLKIVSLSSMVAQQEGVVVGAPSNLLGGTASTLNLNLPAPVYPAGISASGDFELGGQVNHSIDNQAFMDQAGMTWVKFQIGWHADEVPDSAIQKIDLAHSLGYKVLLSIVSTEKYPSGIDIPAYLAFLRTVSSYGPDAIEIWNEPNLDYEWPRGEISGSNYVSWLLAPSYNAIKKIDPSIMVISAAPAPNGAFFGEGGCSAEGYGCDDWLFVQQMAQAGASNYMDCVGVHFNAGATSPMVTEGHPADPGFKHYSWYYSTMLQLYSGTFGRPVCFTELGYLSPAGLGGLPARFSWASDTTLMEQSMWLAEAAQLSRDSGLVRLMIVWNVDFTYWGDDPMAGYAIVRLSGECPACQTLGAIMN